jgi:hypothetical protein
MLEDSQGSAASGSKGGVQFAYPGIDRWIWFALVSQSFRPLARRFFG